MFARPKLIVSECLNFSACRYDGTHINAPIIKQLEPFVDFIKVCPEVAIGFQIPRESLRLIENVEKPELVVSKTGLNVSEKMHHFSDNFLSNLGHVHGFILKSRSPSCGIKDVKVYQAHGKSSAIGKGKGLFANAVLDYFPNHPIEDEGRLTNFDIREAFFYKIFTLAEFDKDVQHMNDLVKFHTRHKYAMMSYQPKKMTELGQILANASKKTFKEDRERYKQKLYDTLLDIPSVGRNINTLTHIYGYFKNELTENEKKHYFDLIEKYRDKKIPYSTPLMLIQSWSNRFNQDYLINQSILNPFPSELLDLYDSGK